MAWMGEWVAVMELCKLHALLSEFYVVFHCQLVSGLGIPSSRALLLPMSYQLRPGTDATHPIPISNGE